MSKGVEVLPVTADEVIRLLGLLRMEEVERLLDDIKFLREEKIFNQDLLLVSASQEFKESTINKIERVVK